MEVVQRDGRTGVESAPRVMALWATGLLETGPEEAFNRLTRMASRLLRTPLVFLTVVDDRRSFLKGAPAPALMTGPDGTFEVPARDAACQVVVDAGEEVVSSDVREDPRLSDLPQILDFSVMAWAGVPLVDPYGRVLGNMCAFDTDVREWTAEDLDALRTVAAAANGEVALRMALAGSQQHAARAADLAETLRESLVPAHPPRIPGVEIASVFRPGGTGLEVLGDFYDVIPIPGRDGGPVGFGVVMGDVCGHGASAARTTAMARSAVRTAAHGETDPVAVLSTVDEVLRVWFGPRASFVTAVYATFHRRASGGWTVRVAGAGHPPALVRRRAGDVQMLDGGGRVLGIGHETWIHEQVVELADGESLVLYTDGIIEARDELGRQLDEPGVVRALAAAPAAGTAGELADVVLGAAEIHTGTSVREDDAAVVVVSAREDLWAGN